MFSIFRNDDQLENVENQLEGMLSACQDAFRLATSAVFAEADVWDAGKELDELDKELNRTERAIRRELLIHGTVRGADIDMGLMLAYMAIAKDIERIGDYCKNIWNLAQMGIDLGQWEDREELLGHRSRVAELLQLGRDAFVTQDTEKVHELIPAIRQDLKHYDAHVVEFVKSDEPGYIAAPRALWYRYIKRISAHLSNVLTSVVMPVDRLDFYKKSKALDGDSD